MLRLAVAFLAFVLTGCSLFSSDDQTTASSSPGTADTCTGTDVVLVQGASRYVIYGDHQFARVLRLRARQPTHMEGTGPCASSIYLYSDTYAAMGTADAPVSASATTSRFRLPPGRGSLHASIPMCAGRSDECFGGVSDFVVRLVVSNLTSAPAVHINAVPHDSAFVMAAGLTGTLRLSSNGCLYAYHRKTRFSPVTRTDLVWPAGTTVLKDDAGAPVVFDSDGVAVAKVGRSLRGLGGGGVSGPYPRYVSCRAPESDGVFYIQGDMRSMWDNE
jgi:hypothetical protein